MPKASETCSARLLVAGSRGTGAWAAQTIPAHGDGAALQDLGPTRGSEWDGDREGDEGGDRGGDGDLAIAVCDCRCPKGRVHDPEPKWQGKPRRPGRWLLVPYVTPTVLHSLWERQGEVARGGRDPQHPAHAGGNTGDTYMALNCRGHVLAPVVGAPGAGVRVQGVLLG